MDTASGDRAVVGGGYLNAAWSSYATVSGGLSNRAGGSGSFIGGGNGNSTINTECTVGGGNSNHATGGRSTVGGGLSNTASSNGSTVAGGASNTASGVFSTIGGGAGNTSGAYSSVAGGYQNTVSGFYSCIPGGAGNTANGLYNLVFGVNVVPTVTEDQRIYFFEPTLHGRLGLNREDMDYPIHVGTDGSNGNGAFLTTGGVWTNGSSRTFKDRYTTLDSAEVVNKVRNMDIRGWWYKGTQEYHIGPFAEDFRDNFGTGVLDNQESRKYLASTDIAGVALYTGQQLLKQNEAQQQELTAQAKEIAELKFRLARLESKESVPTTQPTTTTSIGENVVRILSIVPDPASSGIVIKFHSEVSANITVKVLTATGEAVVTVLNNEYMNKGDYEIEVRVQDFASGWYVATVQADNTTAQRMFRVVH